MKIALWLHLLGVTVWVGGMFFAYVCLRPSATRLLEPAQRLPLWSAVFVRFFTWVWLSVALVLASGLVMWMLLGGKTAPLYTHLMAAIGLAMMLIFAHVYFAPYRRLRRHVALKDWPQAGLALNRIRFLVATNLLLGLITITVATLGQLF